MKYDFKTLEAKAQAKWRELNLFKAEEHSDKPSKYVLDMFPYPSGAGLHIGHVEGYTATDIYSRYLRHQGFNVLHPMGWDAFGLPAENYAVKTGIHPSETTKKAIETFTRQIDSIGLSYDWSHEINSSDEKYYKWTQWLFLQFYKHGLAYKGKGKVNWCDDCKTVLANEQVVGGKCDRCGNNVSQKDLSQWYFKITDFIENQQAGDQEVSGLISGLDKIDWPESTKAAQRNWIGRSEGAEVDFKIANSEKEIKVFTTRPDTLFGCTYMVLCPEHELVEQLAEQIENIAEVRAYLAQASLKSDLERQEEKEKTGVELKGIKAVNPVNNIEVPIFVADYVLSGYGTGAIMAVPAHDERDWAFAKKFNLPIIEVLAGGNVQEAAFTGDGLSVNSEFLTGLVMTESKAKIIDWLEAKQCGKRTINYRLRDWLISRQRYWGAPIPIIYCEHCGAVPVPEQDLPVRLPTDVDFKPTGESPLVNSETFHDVKCPTCGEKARRESDTMDTFVCSSWYFMRFADANNTEAFASPEKLKQWLPVDVYLGGAEHTVLHLLYARFFTKALMKFGLLNFDEPFLKLRHQGIILGEDGNKMSKSKGNVVNPDEIIEGNGADALRLYEMFMGPLEDMKPWNTKGIVGIDRFLERIWKLQTKVSAEAKTTEEIDRLVHKTIKKVTDDVENFKFNTAISAMMILLNDLEKQESLTKEIYSQLLILLSPFAPHLAEGIWEKLGNQGSVCAQAWPKYDESKLVDGVIKLVVQVNGRVRETLEVSLEITEPEAIQLAKENENVAKWLEGKEIARIIFVPGKLLNIVVK